MWKGYKIAFLVLSLLNVKLVLLAQNKSLVFKTGKSSLKKEDINIYSNRLNLDLEISLSSRISEVKKGKIYISRISDDTLILVIKGKIPLILQGLSKIKKDTIWISDIPLCDYVPIDTLYVHSFDYYMEDTVMHVTKQANRTYTPNNSHKFMDKQTNVLVNDIKYPCSIQSETNEDTQYLCSPGMSSTQRRIIGVNKYYIIKL